MIYKKYIGIELLLYQWINHKFFILFKNSNDQ